jgi:glycosyltransferase involved in cell wall biosynthesis
MRFHSLVPQHAICNLDYVGCAYTQKALKFAKMMTSRGHEVITYSVEGMATDSTEDVVVVDTATYESVYGTHDYRSKFFRFDQNDLVYKTYNANAVAAIQQRKKPGDFILPWWGSGHRAICDFHSDMICVEPGIGYAGGHWAKYKIFESYAIYHAYCGLDRVGTCDQSWYDCVIPNFFDADDFEFKETKSDYFLFLGRVYSGKGVHIVIQLAERMPDIRIIIAGQNPDNISFPPNIEFVGYADTATRKALMANARAAFVPSQYVEPFGGVQVELLLSGTPTITTDWGAFAENNLHGITGYRCRTFDHFVWAVKNIDKINPQACRTWGENFLLHRIAPAYEEYFQMIQDIHGGQGWYEPHADRTELDWLNKIYPSRL